MAINPSPRQRRAVVTSGPDVVHEMPLHEVKAREFWKANKAKNAQGRIEKAAGKECHKAMLAAKVGEFEFLEGNETVVAKIAGGTDDKVNIRRLWAMTQPSEEDGVTVAPIITIDQFLDAVSGTQASVKKALGTNVLMAVLDSKPKEATLSIKKKGAKDGDDE